MTNGAAGCGVGSRHANMMCIGWGSDYRRLAPEVGWDYHGLGRVQAPRELELNRDLQCWRLGTDTTTHNHISQGRSSARPASSATI